MEAEEKTYEKLKALLDNEKFPKAYKYKFIVLTATNGQQEVSDCFGKEADITLTYSKSKKYTTVTIVQTMDSSQAIIDKYLLVSKVKNVIHL